MASAIVHLTKAGERWDLLAFRYYGDAFAYSEIVMANPTVPIEPVFEAGIEVLVPIISATPGQQTPLPPWMSNVN